MYVPDTRIVLHDVEEEEKMFPKQLNTLSLNPRLAKSVKAGQYGNTDWSFSTDAKRWPS
jgi:hypothetical protein